VALAGHDITRMREAKLTRLRRDRIGFGFVFQSYNLLSELTDHRRVLAVLRYLGVQKDAQKEH
jgi:putative ABC transport system ATP-binding protein